MRLGMSYKSQDTNCTGEFEKRSGIGANIGCGLWLWFLPELLYSRPRLPGYHFL
jgi:hypothetical protein